MKKVLPIIPVPEWMKKRMAAVHSASPAPLSEMLRQGRASERIRRKLSGDRHGTGGKP